MLSSLVVFFVTSLLWEFVLRRPLDTLPEAKIEPSPNGKLNLRTLWVFSRPYTIKATVLVISIQYPLMYVYSGMKQSNFSGFLRILSSAVLANIFIVAVNQLTDVECDKANGKPLAIASGAMKFSQARLATGLSLCLAIAVSFAESNVWFFTVIGLCFLGYVYSVPPLRLKRHPVTATLCIVLARAILLVIGLAHACCAAFDITLDAGTNRQIGILSVFSITVSIMKDIPDIKGDADDEISSLAIRWGAYRTSRFCLCILTISYIAVICFIADDTSTSILHAIGCVYMWGHWYIFNTPDDDSDEVVDMGMDIYLNTLWPLVYYEFVAYYLPIALESLGLPPLPTWFLLALLLVVSLNSAVAIMKNARKEKYRRASRAPETSNIKAGEAKAQCQQS
ncbi:hypoxanthine-guanine phosphoribosyltransferase [Perkinsus chesapeaki]|uniref:Hypoxanthine-guanine phosphoribosyltransferase n=1 Tax=Perkinsus chesapeaki TaxID=330153 RepID=A0A7J6M6J6_PERCH|nr:hypoxanthine-guanine phosphoribosyltransferase [Perkinsus chesapeaki]